VADAGPESQAVVTSCVVDGREFVLTRRGHGAPLLLLNGFAATRNDWDPTFLAALCRRHELILVDHRGVGRSSCDEGPFTIGDLAADVSGAIDALGLERPDVLGWSMGGFVALSLAAARPELVGKLVLLSTSAGASPTTLGRPSVQAQLRDFSGTPREHASRLIALLFEPERACQVDADFGEIVAASLASFPVDVADRQWQAIKGWACHGVAAALGELALRALIATGSEDIVIPPENSLALAQSIPDSWLARFPRSGHGFIADYPEQLSDLINTFLSVA
jgi:pimeloyl-ACP methyl ester carboxylesterase